MDQQITPKEVKILENPEDIQERREQVLGRYANFKSEARNKRDKLEDSRRFQVKFQIIWSISIYSFLYFKINLSFDIFSTLNEMQMNSRVGFMKSCKLLPMKATKIRPTYRPRFKSTKLLKPKSQLIQMRSFYWITLDQK